MSQQCPGVYDTNLDESQLLLKSNLMQSLRQMNKKSQIFEEIITDYLTLLQSYQNQRNIAEQNTITNSVYMRMSLPEPKSSTEQEYAAQVDQLSEALQKQEHLNKEQLETINKALQENIKLRSELDTLKSDIVKYTNIESKHESLKKQNKELQDMLKNKEETIAKLQKENATVTKQFRELESSYKMLKIESDKQANIIKSIEEEMQKSKADSNMILESAKRKLQAANMYFKSKESEYLSNLAKKNLPEVMNFEEVTIPKTLKWKFRQHGNQGINSITFNSIGSHFITTGSDKIVKHWDGTKTQELNAFSGFTGSVTDASYDYTEQFLFAGSTDKTAKLWSLKDSKLLTTFTGHIDYINCVATWNSALKGLTGSSDRTVKEWDFDTKKLIRNLHTTSSCFSLGVASDDSFAVTGHADGTVKIWDSGDKPEKTIQLHESQAKVIKIEVLKNETQFLTVSKDYTVKLFDIRKMDTVYTVGEKTLSQYCESSISVSSDKKYFAIGSTKGQIYVCNFLDGTLADTIDNRNNGKRIWSVRWRPTLSQIYVGDEAGLTVWGTKK